MNLSLEKLERKPMQPRASLKSSSDALGPRATLVLREVVQEYVNTGEPIGSRTLSERLTPSLSPATIRSIMAELTQAGLLFSPFVSAGRLPTERGVRLFVDRLLHVPQLHRHERRVIAQRLEPGGRSIHDVLAEASVMLSRLSNAAGVVVATKSETAIKRIDFVALGPARTLIVLIDRAGRVENRIIKTPLDLPDSALIEASNYLNAQLGLLTLGELRRRVQDRIHLIRRELDTMAASLVAKGVTSWEDQQGTIYLRGQANLLPNVDQKQQLENVRTLFSQLETQEAVSDLLQLAERSDGVRIYIGQETDEFAIAGVSLVVASARNSQQQTVGAIGVIGPIRLDYERVVPVVDYAAHLIGHLFN